MSYNDRIDKRFGPGFPNCAANTGRVSVRLDFGLGDVFTVQFQSGAVVPLLQAVATIKAINDNPADPRTYKVKAAGHRTHGGYDVSIAGTYSCRPINNPSQPGSQDPSPHSWPVAIDINPPTNGWGSGDGDHPLWFRQAFLDQGFKWGGDYGDPMHYEHLSWAGEWDGTYPEEDGMDDRFTKFLEALGSKDDPKKPATPEGAAQRLKAAEKDGGTVPGKPVLVQHIHKATEATEH